MLPERCPQQLTSSEGLTAPPSDDDGNFTTSLTSDGQLKFKLKNSFVEIGAGRFMID